MSMTKKDYELLAKAINFSHHSLSETQFAQLYKGIDRAGEVIADYLQADNPDFKRDRFLQECGITDNN